MPPVTLSRRRLLTAAALGASGLALPGCDAFDGLLGSGERVRGVLAGANSLTYRAQRWLIGADALAQEFGEADIRQPQRPNGVTAPDDQAYKTLLAGDFAVWRLTSGVWWSGRCRCRARR